MNSLDKYILRQCLTPLVFVLLVITALAWMTQSLQRIDILIEYGKGFGAFAYLTFLLIPSLLSITIPIALFAACAYALYRLHSDSEIAVMFAAGVSRWRIAAPILLIAFFAASATYYINVDLMPRSYKTLKRNVIDIQSDLAGAVFRSGEFTALGRKLTIYVDDARPGGQFVGLLINDTRDQSDPKTYLARRAVIRDTDDGPVMFLNDGSIQRTPDSAGSAEIVRFDEVAVNIAQYVFDGNIPLGPAERYPHELLNPDMSKAYDRDNAGKLIAEGHARYAGPLHVFAYVLIALFAMIGGPYSRRGVALRLTVAAASVLSVRVSAYLAQGYAETSGAYWTLYALPGLVIAACLYLLFFPTHRLARRGALAGTA